MFRFFGLLLALLIIHSTKVIKSQQAFKPVTEECPDPNLRNEYDPRMAFNKHLGKSHYSIHPRSNTIISNIVSHIADNKVSLSFPVPIFTVSPSSNWNTYSVIYGAQSQTAEWTTFKCPGADLIDSIGRWPWDGAHDYPFIVRDPNHPIHGTYTELRGFHTFIDHTAHIIYCEGCGLFKYNNNGQIIAPATTISDGNKFDGQGTGCGLSWPGVIRREDILSGVIAHAIRMAFSNCDFFAQTGTSSDYVLPAVKTDQPNGCSQGDYDSINDNVRVLMGYRIRLNPTVNCESRLAPKYKNNGIWQQATAQQTAFVRMFCVALQEYGGILSDGAGYKSVIFQAESDYTADWQTVFGSQCDETTCGDPYDPRTSPFGWSYLIRDTTTPSDNRYRDERYGIPWQQLLVLQTADVGLVNECCLNTSKCTNNTNNTSATYQWSDNTNGPQCMNEFCCFKHRTIDTYHLRINDDNCIIYNCTFTNMGSDAIEVYAKHDGTAPTNTLIEANKFVGITQDAIDINMAINTVIKYNIFPNTISGGYTAIRLQNTSNTLIFGNTFSGDNTVPGIWLCAWDAQPSTIDDCLGPLDAVMDTTIENNIFDGLKHGVLIYGASNTMSINLFN